MAGQPFQIFLACQILDPDFQISCREFRPLYDGQARVGRVGRSGGVPYYRNDILINVVKEYLPQGLEAWREAAMAKPEEVVVDALGLRQLYNNQLKAETVVAVTADDDSGRRRRQQWRRHKNVVDSDDDCDSGDNDDNDDNGYSGRRQRR